jgi:hypothetical protein
VAASDDFADTEFGAAAGRAVAGFYVLSEIGEELVKSVPGFFDRAEGFGANAVSVVVEPLIPPAMAERVLLYFVVHDDLLL